MKLSRLTTLFVFLTALSILLAACPAPVAAPAADSDAAAADAAGEFKVGLVTDVGRVNDRSFNQSAWEGVVASAEGLGLADDDIKYIETQDAKDYADNIQQFIDAGYNVIISVGFALGDATTVAAKEKPRRILHWRRPVPGRDNRQPGRPDLQ